MKRMIRCSTKYEVGDIVQYDSNYLGVTPRIHEGRIVSISKQLSSHGNIGGYLYKVEDENGKVQSIDEQAML